MRRKLWGACGRNLQGTCGGQRSLCRQLAHREFAYVRLREVWVRIAISALVMLFPAALEMLGAKAESLGASVHVRSVYCGRQRL
jgi:hypothetical protein